jgi:histidine ammonia-lyase
MKGNKVLLSAVALMVAGTAYAGTVTLDGHHLTMAQAWEVANGESDVQIAPQAKDWVINSHKLVMAAAAQGKPVYGLTTGVGLNKDKKLFTAHGELTKEVVDASRAFNYNALRAHSAGIGPMMPENLARLSMVIRLNTLLSGQSGAQYRVAELYRDFLNKHITPQIPSRGTIGEADILLASHVGSVMIGEWKAKVDGKVVTGAEALKMKGITPLVPEGKDALAILSNSSVAMAYALEGYKDAYQVVKTTPVVFGLSLEGLNGNVAPILPQTVGVRPFPGLANAATSMRVALKGSYLWQPNADRPLQDPLSYRTTVYVLAEADNALKDLKKVIDVQINSGDDNPATILNASQDYRAESKQVANYFVDGKDVKGAIIPSANFEVLPVALALERTSLAVAHLSHNAVQRTIHLSDEHFTGLTRFLTAPGNKGHAFGAIQKAFMGMHVDTMALAQPVSLYGMPVAGDIEDTFTQILQCGQRLAQISENTTNVYALELIHAAQAIDLRRQKMGNFAMSSETEKLYNDFRKVSPYVSQDRQFTPDIAAAEKIIANW